MAPAAVRQVSDIAWRIFAFMEFRASSISRTRQHVGASFPLSLCWKIESDKIGHDLTDWARKKVSHKGRKAMFLSKIAARGQ